MTSGVASCFIVEYSVVVLPEPVGPVTRMMPFGSLDHLLPALAVVAGEAQLLEIADQHFGREDPHHDLLAERRRHGRDAQLDLLAVGRHAS